MTERTEDRPQTANRDGSTGGPAADSAKRRRPRPSTVALGLGVLLGTLLLLWGLDRVARWSAETLLARGIRDGTGVTATPSVQVHGAFFLPQVVAGRYDHVEVAVTGLTAGPLRIGSVHADLRGVHLSFHDLLLRDVHALVVDRSAEQAVLTYRDLNAYLKATGRPARVVATPGGQVKVRGTATVLGQQVSATARVRLGLRGNAVSVQPAGLSTDTAVDRVSEALLGQRFTFLVPLDPLPFGQELHSITAASDGLRISAGGVAVVVRP